MSGAFIQLAQVSGAGGVSTKTTPNFGTTVTAGNLILAIARYNQGAGLTPTFSDTLGNTYSVVENNYYEGTGFEGIAVAVAKNITGGGANAVTVNYGTTIAGTVGYEIGVMAAEYSGFSKSAPYTASDYAGPNRQASPTTGANAVTSGNTPTLSSGNGLLIALSYCFGGTVPSAGSGTSRGTGWTTANTNFRLQDQAVAATTALAATFTATAGTTPHYTAAVYLQNLLPVVFRKTLSGIGGRIGARQLQS